MKIIANRFSNALYHIIEGWRQVFLRTGHEFNYINPKQENIVDVFNVYEPDMYIGTTYELNDAVKYCLNNRPEMIVLLKGNNYGSIDKEIDTKKFPIGIASESEIKDVESLKRVDGIFNFYHKNRYFNTMNYWQEKFGIKLVEGLPAADTFNHTIEQKTKELECDIGFVGGYWKYKAIELDKYILPLCYYVNRYNIKIFGNQPWPVPQFMGLCSNKTANKLFSSATICPNISEPHAREFGFEVNERFFKLAACKAFQISPKLESAEQDIFNNNEIVFVDSPDDFFDQVHNFVTNPDLRQPFIDSAYNTVIKNHTYIHRVRDMWETLGFKEEAKKCQELL